MSVSKTFVCLLGMNECGKGQIKGAIRVEIEGVDGYFKRAGRLLEAL